MDGSSEGLVKISTLSSCQVLDALQISTTRRRKYPILSLNANSADDNSGYMIFEYCMFSDLKRLREIDMSDQPDYSESLITRMLKKSFRGFVIY